LDGFLRGGRDTAIRGKEGLRGNEKTLEAKKEKARRKVHTGY